MNKYIIHSPDLKDRERYITSIGLKNLIWISEKLKDLDIKYNSCIDSWRLKCNNFYIECPRYRILSAGEIECALKHIQAWKLFLDSNEDLALFLEDDIIFNKEDWIEYRLIEMSKVLPIDSDVIFIAGGFDPDKVTKTLKIEKRFYLKNHPSTNTVCGYLLRRRTANLILRNIKDFSMPIDFELNYIFYILDLKVYHYIPYLGLEGTCNGFYKSSQFRPDKWGPFPVNLNFPIRSVGL